jgi:hypothetical protein
MGNHEQLSHADGGRPSHSQGDALQANHIQVAEEEHPITVFGHEEQYQIEAAKQSYHHL